jgi:hypothetical protein
MRANGEGESALTNPHMSIRRRYRKLYEDFKAPFVFWKLIILARKLALAAAAILITNPSLQVQCNADQGSAVNVLLQLCIWQ